MSLVTRCPSCNTLFRVAAAQLQARSGQVRCGRCMHVFDGFAGLAGEQPPPPVDTPPAAAPAARGLDPIAGRAQGVHTAGAAPVSTPPIAFAGNPAQSLSTSAPSTAEPAAPANELGPRARDFAATYILTPLRERVLRKPSPQGARVATCVLLTLLLLGQVAYSFRSQVAARVPVVRALLTGVCNLAGCSVALPQRPDLVKIEASDVHMLDANRPGLIQLTATLRSYATYDLAHPALDLVLTNANEHALARRIFVPEEYLDSTRDPALGIPPRAEITVALDLDTGDLNAAGFRLDLIAAP